MKKKMYALFALLMVSHNGSAQSKLVEEKNAEQKPVVYQVFTRLFGNTNTTNKPWGSKAENGVGKFDDFTPKHSMKLKAWALATFGTQVFCIMQWRTITLNLALV